MTGPSAFVVTREDERKEIAAAFKNEIQPGVLEHPEHSHAWALHKMIPPDAGLTGWTFPDSHGGRSCLVEQGQYGHIARKPTWLYAVSPSFPDMDWTRGPQRLHPVALARHGYAKARRIGMLAMIGGKDKTRIRNATPIAFRDLLISIARGAAKPAGLASLDRAIPGRGEL